MLDKNTKPTNTSTKSKHHTLFIKDIPEIKVKVGELYEITPKHKIYRMYIDKFMETGSELHSIINKLRDAGSNDRLELRIHSPGGIVREGMLLVSLIENNFLGRTTGYLEMFGSSMGGFLFTYCDERIIYPDSELMFHSFSGRVTGKGYNVLNKAKHNFKHISKFIFRKVKENKYLSKKELKLVNAGKDIWLDARSLCERGIATHVMLKNKKITAKKYLKQLKGKKNGK